MIQGIAKMMPNERRVKFSWILKSSPDTFSSPTCNKWKWNKPKWKHKFCDIQPNIQQNTIPKLKGAILNAAEMTCRKVNKPGCATVRNQVTVLFSLPMRFGQHVPTPHIVNYKSHFTNYNRAKASLHNSVQNSISTTKKAHGGPENVNNSVCVCPGEPCSR